MARNNNIIVPEARTALDQLKLEIANELGIENYDSIDKGNLTSRENGYVGGHMVKKLVEDAQKEIAKK
ncbi:alpha/beta-type small acid-soluble spore protein [Anaerosalibacter massiliensis]|uniref:alpha/beta-type small acid-soluble spore protein n=1 Tax=Anaerosalibacter massiliensis TaxID=1347392 RepID=UPI0005B2537F|nr:alpha/beta-type small acid-soluble spore protein [Anaerosalibacter massiliensis]